jgi:hypothetical protein
LKIEGRLIPDLRVFLKETIVAALNDAQVIELMLNPDGKLFIEPVGEDIKAAGRMIAHDAAAIIDPVAKCISTLAGPCHRL